MKQTQVCWWVLEVQQRCEDVSDSFWSRWPSEIGIDEILAYRLKCDPHAIVWKLAYSLGISPQIVAIHLREGLSMKYLHLGWVPHLLISNQNATRLEIAKVMAQ
jgi:hypothetical protein